MERNQEALWQPVRWYCPNCGQLVQGYQNAEGTVKVKCSRCTAVMFSKQVSRHKTQVTVCKPQLTAV